MFREEKKRKDRRVMFLGRRKGGKEGRRGTARNFSKFWNTIGCSSQIFFYYITKPHENLIYRFYFFILFLVLFLSQVKESV